MNRTAALTVCVVTALLGACGGDDAVTGTTYAACADAADCTVAGDTCIPVPPASPDDAPESQCTRECAADEECSGAARCLSLGSGPTVCHQRCITHVDCRNGWGCQRQDDGVSICLPGPSTQYGIAMFETCPVSALPEPCAAELDGCFGIHADGAAAGLCTNTCSDSRPCPGEDDESECVSFNGIDFTCFEECRDDADCPAGLTCRSELADGTTFRAVCLPAPTPPAPPEG